MFLFCSVQKNTI